MPIIGLVVFWIWPLGTAIPVYLVILITSGLLYIAIMRSMSRPVVTGAKGLVGKLVEVIDMNDHHKGHVTIEGEIWDAVSDETLQKGDEAKITGVKDLTLIIAKSHPVDSIK